jgi:hypothetical protein
VAELLGWRKARAAARHSLYCSHKVAKPITLAHVAPRSGVRSRLNELLITVDGANYDGCTLTVFRQFTRDLDPIHSWHLKIENGDIRFELADSLQGRSAIPGRGHNVEIAAQNGLQFAKRFRIVVSHYNSQFH